MTRQASKAKVTVPKVTMTVVDGRTVPYTDAKDACPKTYRSFLEDIRDEADLSLARVERDRIALDAEHREGRPKHGGR